MIILSDTFAKVNAMRLWKAHCWCNIFLDFILLGHDPAQMTRFFIKLVSCSQIKQRKSVAIYVMLTRNTDKLSWSTIFFSLLELNKAKERRCRVCSVYRCIVLKHRRVVMKHIFLLSGIKIHSFKGKKIWCITRVHDVNIKKPPINIYY